MGRCSTVTTVDANKKPPESQGSKWFSLNGAAIQIRTGDLILTKDALYQLSYRAMIAQVHRFWRLTAGTCVIIPEKRAVVKHEFQKMSKKFGKVRHSGKNTKTKRTEYSLCACGRGSKSRTHGTRFWRPLLYQLSYTPIYLSHSLNA